MIDTRTNFSTKIGWALCLIGCFGCFRETDEQIRAKLRAILKDDLVAIMEGVLPESLRENPRYEIVEYQRFDIGPYTRKAVVHFYFLKNVEVRIVRKYRYKAGEGKWERYFNEYKFFNDSTKA